MNKLLLAVGGADFDAIAAAPTVEGPVGWALQGAGIGFEPSQMLAAFATAAFWCLVLKALWQLAKFAGSAALNNLVIEDQRKRDEEFRLKTDEAREAYEKTYGASSGLLRTLIDAVVGPPQACRIRQQDARDGSWPAPVEDSRYNRDSSRGSSRPKKKRRKK